MLDITQNNFPDIHITGAPAEIARSGYRLQRLEIKNFGGYHGPASVFQFDLQGAVFSGDNGAGKSTAIDAYRMLFRQNPRFNSATEGSKDRSVETYYLGQYGRQDGAGGGKPMVLRKHGVKEGFMAVCGVFRTDAGETFTALRMAYFPKKGESAEWRLVTARGDISIETDFPVWLTKGECLRKAVACGGDLHSTYADFFATIGLAFGIAKPDEAQAAFGFIDQSIGVKKLGSIAAFARDNIFPRNSLRQSADGAISAFEKVQESSRQIERVTAMIGSLKTVSSKFTSYETALGVHCDYSQRKLRFTQFAHFTAIISSGRILRRANGRLAAHQAEIETADATIRTAEAEIDAIDATMASKGFHKVNDLKDRKRVLLEHLADVTHRLCKIEKTFAAAGMEFDASTSETLARSFDRVSVRARSIETAIENVRAGSRDTDYNLRRAEECKGAAARNLKDALDNRSAIDTRQIRARNALAEELRLRPDEMPFLAELAKVRDDASEWEGVANRVLGGIGTEILVQSEDIPAARRFLKGTKFPGIRVVLHEVRSLDPENRDHTTPGPVFARLAPAHPAAGQTLASRIEIREGVRFGKVARALIDQHARHICMDALAFETTAEKYAVIREGAVKGGLKTTKDDRNDINDKSKYILGWDNQDQIEILEQTLAGNRADVARLSEERDLAAAAINELQNRFNTANQLLGARIDHALIDLAGITADLDTLTAAIAVLDTAEAGELRNRRLDAIHRKNATGVSIGELKKKQGSAENTIKKASEDIERRRPRITEEKAVHGSPSLANRLFYLKILREMTGAPKGVSVFRHVLDRKETEINDFLSEARIKIEQASNSGAGIANTGSTALRAAEAFQHGYPEIDLSIGVIAEKFENAADLNRAAAIRDEWRAALAKLERDDLPRHKEAFENRRKTFAIDAVQQIQSEANSYASHIKKLETGFNAILSGLIYDPMEGSRARLRIHPRTENAAVQAFRAKLDRAVKLLFSDDHKTVERAVQSLIDEIRVEGDSKSATDRREAILDLRNWHTMDVEEYLTDENGDYAGQRRIYGGQDGASGGQGERLTMLLIGAAMCYTFGAGDETRRTAGLQTIVLDEAFMHGSEEMAAAATDVLAAMGLQVIAATPVQKLQAFAGKTERVFSISKKKEQILHTDSTYAELEIREKRIAEGYATHEATLI